MATLAGDITFYCIPARDGLLAGHVHPWSCEACSQCLAAEPCDAVVLFASAKTHRLGWVHLPCLSKLKFDVETEKVAFHPDVLDVNIKVARGRLGSPGTVPTVPFLFRAAFRVRELIWQTRQASFLSSEATPSSKEGGPELPTSSTKRALRVNTSAEAEPTPADEAHGGVTKLTIPKKELKASSSDLGPKASERATSRKEDAELASVCYERDTIPQQVSGGSGSSHGAQDHIKATGDGEVLECVAPTPESSSRACTTEPDEPEPKSPSERKELLLRAGA